MRLQDERAVREVLKLVEVVREANHITMDVRDLIMKGHHPRREILEVVDTAPVNTVLEIHVPHRTQPLINALEATGLNVVVNQMGAAHVRLMAVKMQGAVKM